MGKFLLETRDLWILSSSLKFSWLWAGRSSAALWLVRLKYNKDSQCQSCESSFSAPVTGGWGSGVIHSVSGFCWRTPYLTAPLSDCYKAFDCNVLVQIGERGHTTQLLGEARFKSFFTTSFRCHKYFRMKGVASCFLKDPYKIAFLANCPIQ